MTHHVERTATVKTLDARHHSAPDYIEVTAHTVNPALDVGWLTRPGEGVPGIGTVISVTYEWEDPDPQ